MVVTLYTGPHCHLCEQAEAVVLPLLSERGVVLNKDDINSDPALYERYRYTIPVISVTAGAETLEKGWPFSRGQVGRLFEQAAVSE